MVKKNNVLRYRINVKGVVQGVGFRPFIYRLAKENRLYGWVLNSSEGVIIEVEGESKNLNLFIKNIKEKAPPMAKIDEISLEEQEPIYYKKFEIKKSVRKKGKYQLVSPDVAICEDCLSELFDKNDRRYLYPFINCTNCGPRFTIIKDMPYDRTNTTMNEFIMCENCQKEYDDPLSRRFHAQPNACSVCGPHIWLVDNKGKLVNNENPIEEASNLLKNKMIIGVKGLGGFQFACDATSNDAVKRMRMRKNRPSKPFAIMVKDVDQVKEICYLNKEEEKLLTGSQKPIVLLERKGKLYKENENNIRVCEQIARNNNYLGVMIPYTPLHYTLLRSFDKPLVMTSGNISEEPIAIENEEAIKRLGHIVDYFLFHNRDIYGRYDDSVTKIFDNKVQMVRRARGYCPYPVKLDYHSKKILAVGPHLKNTYCLADGENAFVSQHIGDLENLETMNHFTSSLSTYKNLFKIEPEIVAYDMHPGYLSTQFAKETNKEVKIAVQHHHAHIASVMAENHLKGKVIGIAFDGTGYGTDETIWGGEFLIADEFGFERVAHFRKVLMPGSEKAIERPYRMAISYLFEVYKNKIFKCKDKETDNIIKKSGKNKLNNKITKDNLNNSEKDKLENKKLYKEDIKNKKSEIYNLFKNDSNKFFKGIRKACRDTELKVIINQLISGFNSPLTSSCGRLFDAVSSLLSISQHNYYEGQAAVELEMVNNESTLESYPFIIRKENYNQSVNNLNKYSIKKDFKANMISENRISKNEKSIVSINKNMIIDTLSIIEGIIADIKKGYKSSYISAKFHNTIIAIISKICEIMYKKFNIKKVVLSGGVFQNNIILNRSFRILREKGFDVFTNFQVPVNDGGISLGQAFVAHHIADKLRV
ncbi:MAG: carbamoyltransferase HypF [Actinobacteria bacterium]|nr:carbamoyltransferase HypF [Actinomycetota bacterium]